MMGVSPTATQLEIKKAYKKLALKHHPDRGGDEEEFKKVQGAYETLGDPDKRANYDRFGKDGLRGSGGMSTDMFTNMFGNMFGGQFGGMFNTFQQAQNMIRKTEPTIHKYNVTLEDLCNRKIVKLRFTRDRQCPCQTPDTSKTCDPCKGVGFITQVRQIGPGMVQQIRNPCDMCNGIGKIYQSCDKCKSGVRKLAKVFQVHLTPELEHGFQYKFAGEGNQAPGSEPGDFIIVIVHKPHAVFQMHGKDLAYTKELTLKEALCGFAFELMHPSGEKLSITGDQVTIPNAITKVDGRGMSTGSALLIKFNVTFPSNLSERQIAALKEIL